MYPVLGSCPICSSELEVTHLHCQTCDTVVQGHFQLNPFSKLNADQLAFVELFVRNEGKLNRVGQQLDLSYSAVRGRLSEVIESLGYAAVDDGDTLQPMTPEQRQEVLSMVAAGQLSAEEAVALLKQ